MSSFVRNAPSQKIENYLVQIIRASSSGSDENQADLKRLASRIPTISLPELSLLFNKLKEFKLNPTYDPSITDLAKAALNSIRSK